VAGQPSLEIRICWHETTGTNHWQTRSALTLSSTTLHNSGFCLVCGIETEGVTRHLQLRMRELRRDKFFGAPELTLHIA
jgi:hypothetical protein